MRETTKVRRWWRLVVGTALVVAALDAGAAENAASDVASNGTERTWHLDLEPYLWFPAQAGTVTVRGRAAAVDVPIEDGLDLLTSGNAFSGMGYFEVRYGRLGMYVDGVGGYAEDGVSARVPLAGGRLSAAFDSKLRMHFFFVDLAPNYRVLELPLPHRQNPLTLDVIAGARMYYFANRLRAGLTIIGPGRTFSRRAAVDKTFDWADPILGVRWEVPLLDALSFAFRADIGGFGAGSDLSWSIMSDVRYWLPLQVLGAHPWIGTGYKVTAFDREVSPGNASDLQFRGPFAGVGLRF